MPDSTRHYCLLVLRYLLVTLAFTCVALRAAVAH
jgi:hypothetical protein